MRFWQTQLPLECLTTQPKMSNCMGPVASSLKPQFLEFILTQKINTPNTFFFHISSFPCTPFNLQITVFVLINRENLIAPCQWVKQKCWKIGPQPHLQSANKSNNWNQRLYLLGLMNLLKSFLNNMQLGYQDTNFCISRKWLF